MLLSCLAQVSEWIYTQKFAWMSVWLNGWVFIYELSGCGLESCCCHLNQLTSHKFEMPDPSENVT